MTNSREKPSEKNTGIRKMTIANDGQLVQSNFVCVVFRRAEYDKNSFKTMSKATTGPTKDEPYFSIKQIAQIKHRKKMELIS